MSRRWTTSGGLPRYVMRRLTTLPPRNLVPSVAHKQMKEGAARGVNGWWKGYAFVGAMLLGGGFAGLLGVMGLLGVAGLLGLTWICSTNPNFGGGSGGERQRVQEGDRGDPLKCKHIFDAAAGGIGENVASEDLASNRAPPRKTNPIGK
eukprot:363607-Chlamydomonas_euryale.AAC.2